MIRICILVVNADMKITIIDLEGLQFIGALLGHVFFVVAVRRRSSFAVHEAFLTPVNRIVVGATHSGFRRLRIRGGPLGLIKTPAGGQAAAVNVQKKLRVEMTAEK